MVISQMPLYNSSIVLKIALMYATVRTANRGKMYSSQCNELLAPRLKNPETRDSERHVGRN